MKLTKVIVVDDSLLVREILQQELERDVSIKVVAKVADAFEARKKIIECNPDVLIVDVIMDKMSGIEFVQKLLPQHFVPVIMISADPSKRAPSEKIDSVVFFDKPQEGRLRHAEDFFAQLITQIKLIANNEEGVCDCERIASKLIAIGASTGGAEAIEQILTALPPIMPPILISQHMPPKFTHTFAARLNTLCRLSVKEAQPGDVLIPGQVYVAPGGYHMSVKKREKKYIINCDENIDGSAICPNIDTLLTSVASAANKDAVGVLLTGMGKDGAAGLKKMRDAGSITIGQDRDSSVIYGMPKIAHELGAVQQQLPLSRIAKRLIELSRN